MKIAFLTPSPIVLKHDWYRDLLYQKVGVPNLAGYLKRAGFSDISQYDFNNQVRLAYAENPERVKLMLYASDEAVNRFLRTDDRRIREQTEFLLDALNVEQKDLFGISLTHFLGDNREIGLGINLAKCLARTLKERFPEAVIALGGLQNMSLAFQGDDYRKILKDCPDIDYAVCGNAHRAMAGICRAVEKNVPLKAPGAGDFSCETINENVLVQAGEGAAPQEALSHYFELLPDSEVKDPSVPAGFPAYDKANSAAYSYTGGEIRGFYHLPASLEKYSRRGFPDNYLTLQVSFSEGCPFNCFFCSSARTGLFALDIGESIRILKILKEELGCRHFLFYNPNFNPTYKYARAFLQQLIKAGLGILWADCFNLRNMDRDLIAMMREAGVIKVVAGVEYPTRRMLKYINKGLSLEKIYRNLEELHKAGIWNHVLLITGLPTETSDDVHEMEDWLKATGDLVNSYTVGSFHMVDGSPFHDNPEKFGFKLKEAMQLYCQSAFDEDGGPAWKEKERRNRLSNEHIRQFIDGLKKSRKPTAARMDDSHLLMYLYRALGHGRKKLIEKLYEEAYTVNPHIAAAYSRLRAQALSPGSGLNLLLRAGGAAMRLGSASRESFAFTLEKGGTALSCSVIARSEDILINPADNLVHGNYFVLRSDGHRQNGRSNSELAAVIAALGARLTVDNVPAAGGKLRLLLESAEGKARFIISLNSRPPAFRHEIVCGKLAKKALDRIAVLLLASAGAGKTGAASAPKDAAAIKKLLPEILNAAESWR
ncbi:MAG: radical SAM protein [Elusimicrobia bacterium]|nr:radical SAM protein [Elusimicrobiota bacterium]